MDIEWKNGKLVQAAIHINNSVKTQKLQLRAEILQEQFSLVEAGLGMAIELKPNGTTGSFLAQGGHTYLLANHER